MKATLLRNNRNPHHGLLIVDMKRRFEVWTFTATAVVLLLCNAVHAEDETTEHGLVLEIGPAAEWPLHRDRSNYGGNIAAESEVIDNWLELEFGITGLDTSGHGEVSGDLLFKKPFRLSPTIELMVGAGPSVTQTLTGRDKGTSASAEFVLDFVFWPSASVGWYVEPAWSITPGTGQKSLGITGGLVIGFP
jgi:hypothetical protein